ncbi:hypothetical protein [Nitrosococcus oceani]|uniref:Uncharacterized protein n=2 Tax=Nitrosococcus oceani TaxID=1229 RepID=Q3JEV3_NITOC|nr:hypothetical protein [Nitrosococcus oceani]KFI20888.1 hypothetical protein IB75_00490 [Nitrosococcus oceani C-27]ABA56643.1 hypothetical protein Noc_0110 [Nitrosococcus oceani ATCC 19707]EDZ66604.1 hypothetical protein NOC27_3284 [Nitrosococcus oceani AFC27]KFI24027.1 hypothetical protein HW44_00475 [Nitrosococcus oceani]GEM20787.1 hypothetical protein NONS58_22090 [Nitrosococcus oceani]
MFKNHKHYAMSVAAIILGFFSLPAFNAWAQEPYIFRETPQLAAIPQIQSYDPELNELYEINGFNLETAEVTDHWEDFKFKNEEGVDVNDLHVIFSVDEIKTQKKGPFGKAVTEDKSTTAGTRSEITLEKGTVKDGETAKISFDADKSYEITHWWWTVDRVRVGTIKDGSPD